MTLVIKTGMADEQRVVRNYAQRGAVILTGVQTPADLDKAVPLDCSGIISVGVCGGLSTMAQNGQVLLANVVIDAAGHTYDTDLAWTDRLWNKTRFYERRFYSTPDFDAADTVAQRAALFKEFGAWSIDNESYAVAQFAKARGVPFAAMRVVSDTANDTIPPAARKALNAGGGIDVFEVIRSLFTQPVDPDSHQEQLSELIRITGEYSKAIAELRTACLMVGPAFQVA